MAGYKINIIKLTIFPYSWNEHYENEIKRTVFITASKTIKYNKYNTRNTKLVDGRLQSGAKRN